MPGAARGFADVFYRDHFAWGRGGSKYPAWESILNETTQLELLPSQMKQAEPQKAAADGAVTARLPETSQWLLGPTQAKPQDQMTWEALRLSGADALAIRACKKLRSDEFAEEVIAHLAGLVGADMAVTLELQAAIPLERLTTWCAR